MTNKTTINKTAFVIKKTLYLDQLMEMFPKMLERTSIWSFYDSSDEESGTFVETLEETIMKLVLPADEVTVYLNGEDEVTLLTEYNGCEVFSTLRVLNEER